jgi:hypothetical protein
MSIVLAQKFIKTPLLFVLWAIQLSERGCVMTNIQYTEDPSSLFNQKVRQIWESPTYNDCLRYCKELFEMGVDDGRYFAGILRHGLTHDENGNLRPGFHRQPKPAMRTVGGETVTFTYPGVG